MRIIAAYALIGYGFSIVAAAGSAVRGGRLAPAGGLVLAITGITMMFASFGILLGLAWAIAVAVLTLVAGALLSAYNARILNGHWRPWDLLGRGVLTLALIALLVIGR